MHLIIQIFLLNNLYLNYLLIKILINTIILLSCELLSGGIIIGCKAISL